MIDDHRDTRTAGVLPRAVALAGIAGGLFVAGLVLGLAVVGHHGGGPIQGWDNQVQAWDLHHRTGLVGASKVVAVAR